ncbi:hexosaminidase [Crossiella equi]|uniref:Hexosaminidase n=1 Tax=Crossiella equi TaxID=130796 RepID=A0ABS5AFL7_9PSEU|nr:family 20 glycosylhydrolase [Crossiella equi]MBP2475131.1 hexosaminidase [Crossiella equi]
MVVTLPAVQEWVPGGDSFSFRPGSRVLVDSAHSGRLLADARTLAADLAAALVTAEIPVHEGPPRDAVPGDLLLTLGGDAALGAEGYELAVGAVLRISAPQPAGVFWGGRTAVQLLRQSATLSGGRVRDWPRHPMRAMLINNATKHFGLPWWENQIRDLSYQKFNELLVYVDGVGTTREELVRLDELGQRYHVTIVPQLNMPGHMDQVLPAFPQYQLRETNGNRRPNALDLSNDEARAWALGLIESHIGLFSGGWWHLGADEYPHWGPIDDYPQLAAYARRRYGERANGWDTFAGFIMQANEVVRAHGKRMRVWNDMQRTFPQVVTLDPEIVVEHWNSTHPGSVTVSQFVQRGHGLVNCHDDFLYHVGGRNPDGTQRPKSDARRIYETLRVGDFQGAEDLPDDHPKLLGIRISQFNDPPVELHESNEATAAALFETYRAVGQLAWGSAKPVARWTDLRPRVYGLGRAPGYRQVPVLPTGPGPGTARDAYEKMTFFATRVDGRVEHQWQYIPGSGPWRRDTVGGVRGGGVVGNPVAVRDINGRLHYLARTRGGTLEHGVQASPGTGPWEYGETGAGLAGSPGATLDAAGRLCFLARRSNGSLVFGRERVPGAGEPFELTEVGNEPVAGDAALTVDARGRLVFLARRSSGRLLHGWRTTPLVGGAWEFAELGEEVAGDPGIAVDTGGRLCFLARRVDGVLLHGWQSRPGQGPWEYTRLGSAVAGDPAVVLDVAGRLTYFVRKDSGALLHGWQTRPGLGPWDAADLSGGLTGDPGVHLDQAGRTVFFVRADNGRIRHGWQGSPGQGPWGYTELGNDILDL